MESYQLEEPYVQDVDILNEDEQNAVHYNDVEEGQFFNDELIKGYPGRQHRGKQM